MDETIFRGVFRGKNLSLQVLDREGAEACFHEEPYAVISITDPQYRHPKLRDSEACRDVLRLTFSDVEERTARLLRGSPYVVAFSSDIAAHIADFVRRHAAIGTSLIVVHCEAGMSRSAGVAAALSRFYNGEDAFFLLQYRPNPWVRRLVLEALEMPGQPPADALCAD